MIRILQLKPAITFGFVLASLLWVMPLQSYAFGSKSYSQFYIQGGTFNFEVENSTQTDTESVSGFGSYTMGIGVTVFEQFMVFGGYSIILSEGFSGSTATGFDFGVRYYHWTRPTKVETIDGPLNMSIFNIWTPYAGIALRSREFLSTLSSTYLGGGITIGTDYRIHQKYFFNAEFRYESLTGPSSVNATQSNIMFGVGMYF